MNAPTLPKADVIGEGLSREDWLGARRIGGSDIAAIEQIDGAWGSPLTVWLNKTGQGHDEPETMYQRAGNRLEQPIAEWFSDETGIATVQPNPITIYGSREFPIATASPDRLTADASAWVEIKNVGHHRTEEWSDGPPAHYAAQAQWQLAVSGLPVCYLAVLIGGQDFRWYPVEEDQARQAEMFAHAAAFWELVESGTAPEVDGSNASKQAIAYRYSDADPDPIEGGEALAIAVDRLARAKNAAKINDETLTKAENAVKLILREHDTGTVDGRVVVTWKEQSRRGLDTDAVRSHLGPDLAKFEKSSSFRVLRVSTTKEKR